MHTTKTGEEMPISSMTDSHLLNTMAMLMRKSKTGVIIRFGGMGMGMDEPWYDEDHLFGDDALNALNFDAYKNEAAARGLSIAKDKK